MPLFNRISIIGLGLIGSSIARSARKNKICTHISAYNKNPETLKKALNQGIIDTAAVSLEDAVRGADLVILCTPIGSYSTITKKIAPHLAENAIITDVGSVKSSVIKSIEDELLAEHKPHFIPAHPIAGSEKSGLDAGTADLFKGRQTILTPNDECDAKSLEKIKKLWTKLGSNVELMDAKEHDEIYATASHLPHFISFCFANSIRKLEKTDILEITNNIDDCFKSFIRLAGSNPAMWSDIFMYNKEAILNNIKKFYQPPSLASIKNGEQAEQWLTRLIAAKQKRKLLPTTNKTSSARPSGKAYAFMKILPRIIAGITIESVENTNHVGGGFLGLTENIVSLPDKFVENILERKEISNQAIEILLAEINFATKMIEQDKAEEIAAYVESAGMIYKRLMN